MSEHTPTLLKADENYVRPVKYISRRPYICAVRYCQEGGADPETQGNADRIAATWNAFHDPAGRTIATEDISEALFWRMYDALETIEGVSPGGPHVSAEAGFKSTFLVLCQARDTARALLSSLKVQGPET